MEISSYSERQLNGISTFTIIMQDPVAVVCGSLLNLTSVSDKVSFKPKLID